MARPTVAVGRVCDPLPPEMFLFFSFIFLSGMLSARAFLPVTPLSDCPKVSTPADLTLDKVIGSWRLAYLFIDENDDMEEDNTCAVAEIMQINETQLEMLLYVDGRKDEYTIDRYTKEFDVRVLSPGNWIIQTTFSSMEFIHVNVIDLNENHLILTFCANPFTPETTSRPPETGNDYDSFLNIMDRDSMDDIFKAQRFNKLFKDLDDVSGKLERQRRIRRPSRLLRGRRHAVPSEEPHMVESPYERMMKYLRETKSETKSMKHLWTAVLVKDNNVSALRFVENASLLMKYGFKIAKGQLISFGRCSLTKK